ncbi:MAG: hypothetical protein RIT45_2832 [Pseudomonadota bacterium]
MAKAKASAAKKETEGSKARRPLTLVQPPDDKKLNQRGELLGLVIVAAAFGFGLALWSFEPADLQLVYQGRGSSESLANYAGPVGTRVADLALGLLGLGAWAVDALLWVVGIRTLLGRDVVPPLRAVISSVTLTLGTLALLHLAARGLQFRPYGKEAAGLVGSAVAELLRAFLSTAGAAVLATLLVTASVSAISERPLFRIAARWLGHRLGRASRDGAVGARSRMQGAFSRMAAARAARKEARVAAAAARSTADAAAEGHVDANVELEAADLPPIPTATPEIAEPTAFGEGRVALPDTRPSSAGRVAVPERRPSALAPAVEPVDDDAAIAVPATRVSAPQRAQMAEPPRAPIEETTAEPVAPIAYDDNGFPLGTPLAPKRELVPSAHRRVSIGTGLELVETEAGSTEGDDDAALPTGAMVFDLDSGRMEVPPPVPAAAEDDDDDGVPTMQLDAVTQPQRPRAPQPVERAPTVASAAPAAQAETGAEREGRSADAAPAATVEPAASLKDALAAARAAGPRIVETEAMRNKGSTSAATDDGEQGALDIGDKKTWRLPPRFIVQPPPERVVAAPYDVLVDNARILEQKLSDFKIQGEVTDIRPGPVVTTYEYKPAPGVKISRIANLKDDLTMSLAALRVRVVAPIPGRDVVGIEVPNKQRQIVYFREMIESKPYADSASKLTIVLGKDIEGAPVCTDLAKAPHLLVAGATGTGKSVGINSFLASMLFKATPDDVRMILIDPKVLELSVYEGIPHLMLPVIDDPHKAELALKWACREMDRRYHILADAKVRNIAGYKSKLSELRERARRSKVAVKNGRKVLVDVNSPGAELLEAAPEPEDMPYIVIVIDEFADLIMASGKEVERAVARLAQKARAAGIHVILATQRPSTDVITGMIKANFPTRISFQVASSIDSKVVLNSVGAESLLGMGDMLFVPPGTSHVRRCHGCWITDDEVVKLSEHWREQGSPEYDMSILDDPDAEAPTIADDEELDPLFADAVQVVIEAGQASVSFLQRKLGIGYGRSARIIDHMEARGIVGPQRGPNKPREILVDGGYEIPGGHDFGFDDDE